MPFGPNNIIYFFKYLLPGNDDETKYEYLLPENDDDEYLRPGNEDNQEGCGE